VSYLNQTDELQSASTAGCGSAQAVIYPCLLRGLDTVECCYYLSLAPGAVFRFEELHAAKEGIARSKKREPVWVSLQREIEQYDYTGMYREVDEQAHLEEQLRRIAISIYGYLKKVSAIRQLLTDGNPTQPPTMKSRSCRTWSMKLPSTGWLICCSCLLVI